SRVLGAPRRWRAPWKRRAVADRLARTLSADGAVRGLAAVTTELVEEARVRHGTLPTATAALGRALTAGLLLGGLSKADERVSLQFSGDGPLGSILVDATPGGHVRVFVHADGRVGAAGGYLLQAMPGADAEAVDRLEENVGAAPPPSDLVRQGLDAPAILARLLAGFPTRVLEEQPLRFQCRCSRERV